jgi:hypothetical protein
MGMTVAAAVLLVWAADNQLPDGVRRVPIPLRDGVYEEFETTTITTDKGLKDFIQRGGKEYEWAAKYWEAFGKTLTDAKVDFKTQALVLVRHSEPSGSIRVRHELTEEKDGVLRVTIRRKEPSLGTWDMAYYCWAYVVPKERELKVWVLKER